MLIIIINKLLFFTVCSAEYFNDETIHEKKKNMLYIIYIVNTTVNL